MLESRETRKLCDLLKKCNAMVFAIVGNQMQGCGWPDRYIVHKHFRGWVEFKGPKTQLRGAQRIIIRQLVDHGDTACVIRFTSDGLQLEDTLGNVIDKWSLPENPHEASVFLYELGMKLKTAAC